MGWLAATRQRLPSELRRRPSGAPPASVAVVHAAQLFLRVTVDLTVLNSACGSPLLLHGAWEWFDGVLYEGMLRQITSNGNPAEFTDWRSLLRGDPTLCTLFDALRPLALGLEGAVAPVPAGAASADAADEPPTPNQAAHRAVRAAAKLWRETVTEKK